MNPVRTCVPIETDKKGCPNLEFEVKKFFYLNSLLKYLKKQVTVRNDEQQDYINMSQIVQ